MTGRSQQLTDTRASTPAISSPSRSRSRVEEVNSTLKTTGDSLVLDLSLRGGDVVVKLEQTGPRITDTIVQRGNKVSDTFRESAEQLGRGHRQPRRRGARNAGDAPAVVRGHVQPRRLRARRDASRATPPRSAT